MAQHISIRVPWKDNGYTGLICEKPCYNTSCMRLKNIAENKKDDFEGKLAGKSIKGHEADIPCLSEGGCFMSEDEFLKITVHPYKKNNPKTHGHFLSTELKYLPYSLPARPFGWTMLEKRNDFGKKINIEELADLKGINYDSDNEPNLGWNSNWVQDAGNQREIFNVFYKDVEINKSLVITYAKQVPFVEEAKRIVTGIGFVTSITEPPEHKHTNDGELRSILWETMIGHSIRSDRKNGFLLPYKEMMDYAEKNPDFDISSIAVLVDDENFDEFSYATEQLSYDAVINVLLKTIKALRIIKGCIPGNWNDCIKWCKARLEEVWLDRGPFPGLGSMLTAVGFKHGNLIAGEAKKKVQDISNFENEILEVLSFPKENFTSKLALELTSTKVNALKTMPEERKKLFWLLARINLTAEQAQVIFNTENRGKYRIYCSDKEIIENPYILYEKTRICKPSFQISVNKIDMAVFPASIIAEQNPVPEPSYIESADDKRRIRALSVSILETQAGNGHTVYPQFKLVEDLNNLPLEPECKVSSDIIDSIIDFLAAELILVKCEDDTNAFQLKRLNEMDCFIRNFVEERLKAERFKIKENWSKIVDDYFNILKTEKDDKEIAARKEKIAILNELADSPFTVLIGGAGTGKTTLLSLLCKSEQIKNGKIMLLAPTGKARVKISKTMNSMGVNHDAYTIAQFLIKNDRFDWNTMTYRLSKQPAKNIPATVIIDESSMMTEEMFASLLSALDMAQRIIFVGDPNQLPPIGAGRPFVDLVRHLKQNMPPFPDPQVTKGFGELTITRRQADDGKDEREDSKLAEWFKETAAQLDDNIFIDLQANKLGEHISFKPWTTPEDLQQKILETICEETEMTSIDDIEGFDLSLGGKINSGWMNFGSYPSKLDSWQILSAYKNDASVGSSIINRYIHEKYRTNEYVEMEHSQKLPTHHLLGTEGIVYGDKIINVRNQKKEGYLYDKCLDPSEKNNSLAEPLNYVANGEVGIVERLWEKPKAKANTHQIRFNSQPLFNYNWYSNVSEEGNNDIELAYALTVHKAQGSEFEKVILVLSEPSRMLSRELLYTAITRQTKKIVILYNEDAYKLKNYSSVEFSDIAKRFTCLFAAPKITEFKNKFYEEKLIHKTKRGEMVRSKSEVIIANMLFDADINYLYEEPLSLKDGSKRSPDFTIPKNGKTIYWEHLGMLQKESYRKDWDVKRKQYEENDIIEGKNLIISKDGLDGSLDSQEIDNLINKYLK
ncbi:AAA family ATPase [Treponema sp.]|uniref:AAA family ATPase n=1 Tax=Treponema sp. TaxID=166 RepID=UPI003F064B17